MNNRLYMKLTADLIITSDDNFVLPLLRAAAENDTEALKGMVKIESKDIGTTSALLSTVAPTPLGTAPYASAYYVSDELVALVYSTDKSTLILSITTDTIPTDDAQDWKVDLYFTGDRDDLALDVFDLPMVFYVRTTVTNKRHYKYKSYLIGAKPFWSTLDYLKNHLGSTGISKRGAAFLQTLADSNDKRFYYLLGTLAKATYATDNPYAFTRNKKVLTSLLSSVE